MRGPDQQATSSARRLRVNQTRAESVLWQHLRNRQIDGHKFVRQEPVEHFIYDFVCRESMLVVEVDGGQHCESATDKIRDAVLIAAGFQILRFWNNDVLENINGVVTTIQIELAAKSPSPRPSPRKDGERGKASRQLTCASCGATFDCTLDGTCWCMHEALMLPMPTDGEDCLCPTCLRALAAPASIRKSRF